LKKDIITEKEKIDRETITCKETMVVIVIKIEAAISVEI
jgi:hypothetical protein